jgi:SAM-dependent methyltransferase
MEVLVSSPAQLGLGEAGGSSFGEGGIEKRLTALSKHVRLSGDRLLDVGCASGSYTMRLAQGFHHVDAIDVEPERLEMFRAALEGTELEAKITIAQMSADALAFDDDQFDMVTTIEVLEHVPDLEGSIREIHRVLRPGGSFCITSPNRYFPIETHGVIVGGRRRPPSHAPFITWVPPLHRRVADARSFTVRGLSSTIEAAGFRRTSFDYIMPPFDRSAMGRRIRPVTDRIERSPLKFFGMALVLVFTKNTVSGAGK